MKSLLSLKEPAPILFVEDDPAVRETFTRMTNRLGFVVHCAPDGQRALQLAENYRYSVVVTDLQLPDIDGMSLIKLLRKLLAEAKFLVLTGLDDPGAARLDTSIVDIMPKPLDLLRLQDSLAKAVRLPRKPPTAALLELSILLVEDDLADRVLYSRYLRSEIPSARIQSVESAVAAVQALKQQRCDAVLCDLNLPDAHGLEVVDMLLKVQADLPVVILSSTQNEMMATEALRRGAQDYLFKNLACASTLGRALRFAMARASFTPPCECRRPKAS